MSTEQCVRILVFSRTQVHCVTVCSCSPIEMQIRLSGARKTISVICTLTISNKTVNFKLFNNVTFIYYAVHRVLIVPVAAPGFWFGEQWDNISYLNYTQVLYFNGVAKVSVRRDIKQKCTH